MSNERLTNKECRKICELIKTFCGENDCTSKTCPFYYESFGCTLADAVSSDYSPCDWDL